MTTKHTPGELVADFSTVEGHCGFKIKSGTKTIATVYADIVGSGMKMEDHATDDRNAVSVANAARIVHTWNCHDELVTSLQDALAREYNPFEPDNQSDHYHRWLKIFTKAKGE